MSIEWNALTPEQRDALIHEHVMHLPLETPCIDGELDVYKDYYWQCTCGWEGPINGNTEHTIPVPHYSGWQMRDRMIATGYFTLFRYQVGLACSDSSFHTVIRELDDDKMRIAALRAIGIEVIVS